jgi:hypothetical protein
MVSKRALSSGCFLSSLFGFLLGFGKVSSVTDVKGSCLSALTLQAISASSFHRDYVSANVSYPMRQFSWKGSISSNRYCFLDPDCVACSSPAFIIHLLRWCRWPCCIYNVHVMRLTL